MYLKELLSRANLNNLENFILTGAELSDPLPEKDYMQRIREAEHRLGEYLKLCFPNEEECDEVAMCVYGITEEYTNVYFEIGLLTGAKIALQASKKLKDLT